jgi:asparagine N-glycosylation enzyme membrane subunit Stt3
MKGTQRITLAALLFGGAAISYFALRILFRTGRALPRLPWSGAPLLLLLTAVLFITAFNVNRRLEERRKNKDVSKKMDPLFLARLVLLAKSASHGGALLSGIYVGFCSTYLVALGHLEDSSLIWNSALDAGAALAVAVGGYFLERVLTIKDDGKVD